MSKPESCFWNVPEPQNIPFKPEKSNMVPRLGQNQKLECKGT